MSKYVVVYRCADKVLKRRALLGLELLKSKSPRVNLGAPSLDLKCSKDQNVFPIFFPHFSFNFVSNRQDRSMKRTEMHVRKIRKQAGLNVSVWSSLDYLHTKTCSNFP